MKKFLIILFIFKLSKSSAEEIFLKCDEFEMQYNYSDIYCTVSNIRVEHSETIRVFDYPKTNNTIYLRFYESVLLYVPQRLFDGFPNLKSLDVPYTEVLEIPRNTFMSAHFLNYLNISHNNITQITTAVFMGANSLMGIDLSWNKISKITEHVLKGLSNLIKISFSYNRIKELPIDLFTDNIYLEIILLDNNAITSISPNVFNRMVRIRDIDLTNNHLLTIDSSTFHNAYLLESLLLSGNNLTEFHIDLLHIIKRVNLDGNRLTNLFVNSTRQLRADNNQISSVQIFNYNIIEKLLLAKNQIADISNITNLTNLQILDLSYNQFGPLNISTLDNLRRLRELRLRGSNLKRIKFGMFSKQTNLEILDMSFSNLIEINMDMFAPYLAKLKEFYIDGNNLTEIHGKMRLPFALPALTRIGLSRNRFNCTYLHEFLVFQTGFLQLHIEPGDGNADSTHVKSLACISTDDQLPENSKIPTITEKNSILISTIIKLKAHEAKLELYLSLFKVSAFILIIGISLAIVIKYLRWQRPANYLNRFSRADSIEFRSSTTVNAVN